MAEGFRTLVATAGRRRLVVAFFGSIFVAILELVGVGLVLPLIVAVTDPGASQALPSVVRDLVPQSYDRGATVVLGCLVVGAFIARALVTLGFRWWLHGYVNQSEAVVATSLMRAYMHAPPDFHRQRNSADLIRVLHVATEQMFSRVVLSFLTIATEGLVACVLFATLLVFAPLVALSLLAYLGVATVVFVWLTSRRAGRIGRRYQREGAESIQQAQEMLGGLTEIAVRGVAPAMVAAYGRLRARSGSTKQRLHFLNELPRTYLESAFLIGIGLLLLIVILTSGEQSDATASLALVAAVGFRAMPSLVKLAGSLTSARAGIGGIELVSADIRDLGVKLSSGEEPSGAAGWPNASPVPEIRFDDVSFSYRGSDRAALENVRISIPPSSWVGVVGPSGSGKTTMLMLLLGLLEPASGEITADGQAIHDHLSDWRARIGYVPQNLFVTDASLAENIRLGLRAPDDASALQRSIDDASLRDLVATLPEGLETRASEGGLRLSGGQRQRLGLARALYRSPTLLVLDEATSALDVDTETSVLSVLNRLRSQLTIITVAHRASTVRFCDQILVLDQGRVRARGTYEELVTTDAFFRRMVDEQQLRP